MAIYTKKGDTGQTKVFDKKTGELKTISKSSCKIAAIGTIDELNSYLGVVGGFEKIQTILFSINSILAGANLTFPKNAVKDLEKQIDVWEGELPVLKNFIIYSGFKKARKLFFARALARRAERELVAYSKKWMVNGEILKYMNRLSDFLFMAARSENFKKKIKEKVWKV